MVQLENSVLMVFWIRSSVSKSTAAVASSRIKIFVLWSNARAKQISCLSPMLENNERFCSYSLD